KPAGSCGTCCLRKKWAAGRLLRERPWRQPGCCRTMAPGPRQPCALAGGFSQDSATAIMIFSNPFTADSARGWHPETRQHAQKRAARPQSFKETSMQTTTSKRGNLIMALGLGLLLGACTTINPYTGQ